MNNKRRIALFFVVIVLGIVLDQWTKSLARTNLGYISLPFIPGILNLKLVMNTGAAFSIGSGATWIFILLSVVIVAAAIFWVVLTPDMPLSLTLALGLVASGGIGNLIDRVAAGQVTDFLSCAFINFPVFNVADIFVTCGVALTFIFAMLWDDKSSGGEA